MYKYKFKYTVVICSLLALPASAVDTEFDFTKPEIRTSYSLGIALGKDLKKQQLGVDENSIRQGLNDALQGTAPLLDLQSIAELTAVFNHNVDSDLDSATESAAVRQAELATNRRLLGAAFLEANKSRDGITSLPSGVQYQVITEGHGRSPGPTDSVSIEYRATTLDGVPIGKSRARNNYRVRSMLRGLSEAVQLMQVGDRWRVFIPHNLAYGRRGKHGSQTVIMDIKLLSVN